MTDRPWRFITDLGGACEARPVDGGEPIRLARYGVWVVRGDKPEVVATGDDLAELQALYGPELAVAIVRQ
jgi:hypothetical protein